MCWFSMARLFMYVFNLALFLAGGATLGVGIWILESSKEYVTIAGLDLSENGAIVLIVAGSVACIMGFLGCCGAKKKNSGILGLYFTLLLIIVIMQVAVGIWALVNFDSVDQVVDASLEALNVPGDGSSTLSSTSAQLGCCGRNSTDDACDLYANNITPGCACIDTSYGCTNCAPTGTTPTLIYKQSCDVALTNFITDNLRIIGGIGIAIGLAEILGLIFSCCMCQSIKEKNGYA